MSTELEGRPRLAGLVRWHAPSLLAVGAIALGWTLALPSWSAAPWRAPAPSEARVVFGEALSLKGGAALLQRAPVGRVALFVGGVRQPDETFRLSGRSIILSAPPEDGEKASVDYAW